MFFNEAILLLSIVFGELHLPTYLPTYVKDHTKEAESQLKNKNNYGRLRYDLTETHNRLLNDTIERFKKQKMMKEKVAEGLKTENPRTPKFCLQAKIDKTRNPGHPVFSSVNCHTCIISKYVDFHIIYNLL